MLQEYLESKIKGLIKRDQALNPEFPNSSEEIFREAVAHIPSLESGWQTTFATVGVARYMAEVQPQTAEAIVNRLKDHVIKTFPSDRSKARCLNSILNLELDFDWQGSARTLDELIQTIRGGVPPERKAEWFVRTVQAVARKSADEARRLVSERFPDWQDSDIQLHIAEQQAEYDPEGAGKAASDYLANKFDLGEPRLIYDEEHKCHRWVPAPRRPDSKEYITQKFGWLVARYGDIELAEKMSKTLRQDSVEKAAVLGEIGARQPKTEKGRKYTRQARQLLDREDVWAGHYKRLADAFSESNPKLASQFMQLYEKVDNFGVGIPTAQVKEVLVKGNFVEASRIVRTVIEKDLVNPVMTYPPSGVKYELEKLLVEVARTNPQRVVALVDDNFDRTEKISGTDLAELKTEILVGGAKSLIEAGQIQQAKELLARATVLARSMKTTREPHEGKLKGQELARQDEVVDAALMKIKAWTLAKVGAAAAKLEKHSFGL